MVVSQDLGPLVTLYGTRISSHEDEGTSHTSQGIISFSSLVYRSTQGMDEEIFLTYLFNLSQGIGEESILITMLSLVYTTYNELP